MGVCLQSDLHRSILYIFTEKMETQSHLSSFQVEKFKFLFDILFNFHETHDIHKLEIDDTDVENAIEKMREYAGWEVDSKEHQQLRDFERTFYECVRDHVKAEYQAEEGSAEDAMVSWEEAFKRFKAYDVSKMNLQQWLNMWGKLCHGSAGISDFPIWVQILPHILFRIIDKDNNGIVTYDEVLSFYKEFVGLDKWRLEKVAKEGYRAMTANGDYKLNRDNYMYCFANFLLGKSIYGPGKYIFGVFDNRELDETFKIIYAPTE